MMRMCRRVQLSGLTATLAVVVGAGLFAFLSANADETTDDKSTTARQSKGETPTGRRVPNFVLRDAAGKETGLADFRDKNYLVVVLLSCQCPISNQYIPILNEIQQKYGE